MKCQNCNSEFEPVNEKSLYCSHKCRNTYKHRESRRRNGYKNNPEKRKRWASNNPDKVSMNRAKQQNRRKSLPATLTIVEWERALEYFDNKCAYCGEPLSKAHKEHFYPAKLGGGFTKENIVPACQTCNLRKSAKDPLDWLVMQSKGLVAFARVKNYLESV